MIAGLVQRIALRLDAGYNARHATGFKAGWPASSRSDVHYFESDRVLFRYREAQGPLGASTLVFTADPPITLERYDALIALAAADFRVVVFELPGMGFSPGRRTFRFGFRESNDAVAQLLEAVAGPQAVLAFSCAAGLCAIDLAHRRPELVRALVLIQSTDAAGFARWKAARDPKRILARPIIGQYIMRKLAAQRMPAWFRLALGRAQQQEEFCDCAQAAMEQGALWSLASAYQVYLREDLELPPVQQPALALWGMGDGSHTIENRDAIRSVVPGATIHSFDELGHFPELEEPELVYPLIRDWVAALNTTSQTAAPYPQTP
jgi:pimeloyl-ACP methyl ester carboxylesterase